MEVTCISLGATWVSACIPFKNSSNRQAILTCENYDDYLQQSTYVGNTVGRYCNRIKNSYLELTNSFLKPN
jgi:aldose 1-epimerase